VSFDCSLCQTRITALVADVGKKVACPDCGRKNVVPPPPAPKKPVVPAAMEGEQYQLWGVDETPTVDPREQQLFPFECRVCQSLMHATKEQFGLYMTCPDCGARTIAKPRRTAKPRGPALVAAGEEYELDETAPPEPRPFSMPISILDAELHTSARATTVGPDGRLIVQVDPNWNKRPVRPAVPLVQGVWRMLVTQEIIARWVMLSIVFSALGWFAHDSLMSPSGGLGGFIGIMLMVGTMFLGALWLTMAAPLSLAIIAETSDGNDRLLEPPQWTSFDWFVETAYLVNSGVMAGLAGLGAWQATRSLPAEAQWAIVAGAVLLVFPVLLLSAMLENSALSIVSLRLLATLGRCPGPWLLFYVESAAVWGLAAAAAWGSYQAGGEQGLFAAPFFAMAALITYMRLVGRLAWWLSDRIPAPDEAAADDDRYRL
jgi:DNA-directed RNA polymerase subunit RPC12/RpoP